MPSLRLFGSREDSAAEETPVKLKELTEVKRDLLIALFNNYSQIAREGIEAKRQGALDMIKRQLDKFKPKELVPILLEDKLLQSAVEKRDTAMVDMILAHLPSKQRKKFLQGIVGDYDGNVENGPASISEQPIKACIALLEAGIDNSTDGSNDNAASSEMVDRKPAKRGELRRQHSKRFLQRTVSAPVLALKDCVARKDYSTAKQSLKSALMLTLEKKTRPLDESNIRVCIGRLLVALSILQQSQLQEQQVAPDADQTTPTIAI